MARRGRGPPTDYGGEVMHPMHQQRYPAPPLPPPPAPQKDFGFRFGDDMNRQDQWRQGPPPDQHGHHGPPPEGPYDPQRPLDPRRRGGAPPQPHQQQQQPRPMPPPPEYGHVPPMYQQQQERVPPHMTSSRREGPRGPPSDLGSRPPPNYQRGPPPPQPPPSSPPQQLLHQQAAAPPPRQPFYPPPPSTPAPVVSTNTRAPTSHMIPGDAWRAGQQGRGPIPPKNHSVPQQHQMSSIPSPPSSSTMPPPPRTADPRLSAGQKRPHPPDNSTDQWRGGPPPMPEQPVLQGGGGDGGHMGDGGRGSQDPRGAPRPMGGRDMGRGDGGGGSPSRRGRRGGRGGGRDGSSSGSSREDGRGRGRGSPVGKGTRQRGGGGNRGRGGRVDGKLPHKGRPIREGRGNHHQQQQRQQPPFRELVTVAFSALDPLVRNPDRFTSAQVEDALARLPSDVTRGHPDWDIQHDTVVAIGRDLLAKKGHAWEVIVEDRGAVPTTRRPAEDRPEPTTEEKVEVVVPLVRTAYSNHFFENLQDPAYPPRVKSNLDYKQAPAGFPLLRGLSAQVHARVLKDGLAGFLDGVRDVYLTPAGDVEVSTDLLRLLYRLLFVGDVSVSCSSATQAAIVNAINTLVKEAGRELAARDSRNYVSSLLTRCSLDVVSYFRKDILKRLEGIVAEMEAGNRSAADTMELMNVLALLATPKYNLWDARRAGELARLQSRATALSLAPAASPMPPAPPKTVQAPGTPPHVYQPPSLAVSPPSDAGIALLNVPMGIRSPEVSPPPSPKLIMEPTDQQQRPSAAAPRDPRRAFLKAAADKVAKEAAPERLMKARRVVFTEPKEKGDPEHKTYVKSHHYENQEFGTVAVPCTNPKCLRSNWSRRCFRCGRCAECAKEIFCKGAEKLVTGEATGRLSERMDKAIWVAFRERDFDPLLALIKYANVSVNFRRTSKGETALMAAAYNGNMEVCQELLSRGADPLMTTEDGLTAWTFASRYQHNAIAELIQDYIEKRRTATVAAAPIPALLEPMVLSPTPSISTQPKDDPENEEAPLAEGLVLVSKPGDANYHEPNWEEGPSYSSSDATLGLGKAKREGEGQKGPQQKRARQG